MSEQAAISGSRGNATFWRNVATVVFVPPAILLAFALGLTVSYVVAVIPAVLLLSFLPNGIVLPGATAWLEFAAIVLYCLLWLLGSVWVWFRFKHRFRGYFAWRGSRFWLVRSCGL